MAQNCQSSGAPLNYAPYNNYLYSNGYNAPYTTPAPGGYSGAWPPNGAAGAAFASYMSAYPNGPGANWGSFTSQYGLTRGPWNGAMPSGSPSWNNYLSGAGGANGAAAFFAGMGMGMGGWNAGMGGPFGGMWGGLPQQGQWTQGPWTSWWNGNQCPASNWPGWTSGAWSTAPPWTTWAGCTATPTATSVFTTILNGNPIVTSTFGYRVAQAAATGVNGASPTNAASNGKTIAGGAAIAGLMGVIAAL